MERPDRGPDPQGRGADIADHERVKLFREVADLWSERFGNFANAIKPLERIVELAPGSHDLGDAIGRLKEIYTKRRQWRQLIDLLGSEARGLAQNERRAKRSEMARLAAERLGDTRLAIEIHNRILADAGRADVTDTLASLAHLYEREKRYLAAAEILHRQVAAARRSSRPRSRMRSPLLEKLGQIYADRLGAPQQAAAAWKEVLDLEPNHAKALRTLRELYAMAGDFVGPRATLREARPGGRAGRRVARDRRPHRRQGDPPAARRARRPARARSRVARRPAVAAQLLEKARQVWERVLAVDPQNVGAARALAPIYDQQEKWTRLLTVREIELAAAASDVPARLAMIGQIRALCEDKLASKTLAFAWALRAYELDPGDEGALR